MFLSPGSDHESARGGDHDGSRQGTLHFPPMAHRSEPSIGEAGSSVVLLLVQPATDESFLRGNLAKSCLACSDCPVQHRFFNATISPRRAHIDIDVRSHLLGRGDSGVGRGVPHNCPGIISPNNRLLPEGHVIRAELMLHGTGTEPFR